MKELYESIAKKIRNKQTVFVILIIGIVLMLAAGSFKEDKNESITNTYIDSGRYCRNLENELVDILSRMEGVGEVHVMITLENYSTADISAGSQSGEAVLKRIGDVEESAGTAEFYPAVKGVVIVAQGASSEAVSEKIYYAAKAVLDIGGSKIAVVEAK